MGSYHYTGDHSVARFPCLQRTGSTYHCVAEGHTHKNICSEHSHLVLCISVYCNLVKVDSYDGFWILSVGNSLIKENHPMPHVQ